MESTKALDSAKRSAPDRMDYLDIVRGISVVMIVTEHHILGAEFVKRYLYSFSLTPFFLITGFLYAYKKEWERPFKQTVVKNFQRLIYPFATLSVINLIWNVLYYKVLFPGAVPETPFKQMLLHTVSTYGYNALWYLPLLFWGTLLFLKIRKTKYHHHICLSLSLFLIVFYVLFDAKLTGRGAVSYIYCYLFRIAMSVVFLYVGNVLYFVFQRMSRKQEWLLLISCAIVSCIMAYLYWQYPESFPIVNLAVHRLGNPYVYYLSAIPTSVAIMLLCRRLPRVTGVLSYYGRNSIIVMGFHMDIFVSIAWNLVGRLHTNFGDLINSVIVIAMELAMAPVFILIINKFFPFLLKFPSKKT